jgi:hypothetical protein
VVAPRRLYVQVVLALCVSTASPAFAERVLTLTLDAFSVLSLGDKQLFQIPSGGSIAMHVLDEPRGSVVRFRVEPQEFVVGPIPTGPKEGIILRLVKPAMGAAAFDGRGRCILVLDTELSVSFNHPDRGGSKRVRLRFTTEQVVATSADRKQKLALTGVRPNSASRAVQLVAATTNARNDPLGPGVAVYAILSGRLDRMP